MDPYIQLLEDYGIKKHGIPHDIVVKEVVLQEYEYWDWGPHVLHNNEPGCQHPFAVSYHDEINAEFKKKHRYSRLDRFRFLLYQLINAGGYVPGSVRDLVKSNLKKSTRKKIWNHVRVILKKHKLQRYYNRIPDIINHITRMKPIITTDQVTSILKDFHKMHYQFNNGLCEQWDRKYFPNLRFIALKLLTKHGIDYPYTVPLARTIRKQNYLDSLFDGFNI